MQWILFFIRAIKRYYSQPVYTTGSVSVTREIKYLNTRQNIFYFITNVSLNYRTNILQEQATTTCTVRVRR